MLKLPGPVTVVVPTWRRAYWLRSCINSVLHQGPDELLVVGRPADIAAREVVKEAAQLATGAVVRWLEVNRPGHIAPIRRGLAEATGEYVAFVDDDAVAQPGWLESLIAPFAQSDAACVGGMVINPGVPPRIPKDAGRLRWYGQLAANIAALDVPVPREVDTVMEGNCAWRRGILLRLDFDPVLDFDDAAMYGLDLCLQARNLGYKIIYQPTAIILHTPAPRDPSLDRGDDAARGYSYSRNYTYVLLKHSRGFTRLAFAVWWWLIGCRGSYGLGTAVADAMMNQDRVRRRLKPHLRGKADGWRLWRMRFQSASPE